MRQPDQYYFESIKMTSQAKIKIHREYSPAAGILHTEFDQACYVIFMVSK